MEGNPYTRLNPISHGSSPDSIINSQRFELPNQPYPPTQTSEQPEIDSLLILLKRAKNFKNKPFNQEWSKKRSIMVGWLYNVVDHCDLSRIVVAKSAFLTDHFLSNHAWQHNNVQYMKLSSIVSLLIAIKLYESQAIKLDDIAHLTRGEFDQNAIGTHELKMLEFLDWTINIPTPQDFLFEFMLLLPDKTNKAVVKEAADFYIELAVYDTSISSEHSASDIALSATLNALDDSVEYTALSLDDPLTVADQMSFENVIADSVFSDRSLIPSLYELRTKLRQLPTIHSDDY